MSTSIVMATYNGEKYLKEQLDSLKEQSLRADEVIICDDCSKDSTVEFIRTYIAENQLGASWTFVQNEQNLGYAGNFFKALQMAHGDYIFFSDQDDIWCENKLAEMVDVMEKRPEIQLLCSDYTPFSCSDHAPSVPKKTMKKMTNDGSVEKVPLNKRNIYIASLGCDMCIRKSFRDRIAPFWIKGWAHDDYVWKTAQCVEGCYLYHKPLLKRRLHDSNVSMHKMHGKEVRARFLRELAEANTAMYQFAQSVPLDAKRLRFIERTIKACKLRAELVGQRKLMNSFKLLAYVDCYQSKKSILMEPVIALRS